MRYISLFSGIEAATQAWHPLGWEPLWFSEVDPFANAVLQHRYPEVTNLGDIKEHAAWPAARPDLVVGGSPCQGFSVAGLRRGLDDARSNLMLEYLRVVDRYDPRWILWENVPGALSTHGGRDFGALLGGLAELGYGFAYRILDAQYIRTQRFSRAVPQSRRRVFVVGHSGGHWRRAAAVLLEPAGLCGDPPTRRETGQEVAGGVAGCLGSRCNRSPQDIDTSGAYIPEVAKPVIARDAKGSPNSDCDGFNLLSFNARQDPDVAEGYTGPLDSDGTTHAIAFSCKDHGADAREVAPTLRAMGHDGSHANAGGQVAIAFAENQRNEIRTANYAMSLSAGGGKPGQGVPMIRSSRMVRRLNPREYERLQAFPDDWTRIPWRNKPAEKCPDGPRYRCIGNSMAVNVMDWLGRRIAFVDTIKKARHEAGRAFHEGMNQRKNGVSRNPEYI